MLRVSAVALACFSAIAVGWTPSAGLRAPTSASRAYVSMVDQMRWSKAKGEVASVKDAPSDIAWARAAWAAAKDDANLDEGCYLIDSGAPDASREWFFCSEPSADADMTCEAMPEWMGTLESGETVYICSTVK